MSNLDLNDLVAEITAEPSTPDGMVALINGFVAYLDDAGPDPDKVAQVRNAFAEQTEVLVAAVFSGTPTPAVNAGIVTPAAATAIASEAMGRGHQTRWYNGKRVGLVREARPSDVGYDTSKGPQTIIRLRDGSHKVVLSSEIATTSTPTKPSPQNTPIPARPLQAQARDARA